MPIKRCKLGKRHDSWGDLASVTDPKGNVTSNTYDIRGDKLTSTDPDLGVWHYTYDGLGELLTQTDAKNQVTDRECA